MTATRVALTVRHATPTDAETLSQLAADTFRDAFGADNDPADLAAHLARAYGPRQQGRELADPAMRTLLGYVGADLAAYTQLRRGAAPVTIPGTAPLEVWRFYVVARWHGQGLAQALMQHVHDEARLLGADTLWLGVWERNPRAIAFYQKAGFVDVGSHIFMVGNDAQTDRIMARGV